MESEENPLECLASCAESMETSSASTSPPSSPSSAEPTPAVPESPDVNGFLRLKGNPAPWIENNTPDSHLSVKHLQLDFSNMEDDQQEEIDNSIDKLTLLTHLTICKASSLNCLPNSISTLHNLQNLMFDGCEFEELPANMGLLKNSLTRLTLLRCFKIMSLPEIVVTLSNLISLRIEHCRSLKQLTPSLGQLVNLTELTLRECRIQYLPESIVTLSNLTDLHLTDCFSLKELPASLGQLPSLNYFSLNYCNSLQFLPDSMSNLLHLETLYIQRCHSLKELPLNLKVAYLELVNSGITCIPGGLVNLRHLEVVPGYSQVSQGYSQLSLENLKDSVNLQVLIMDCGYRRLEEAFLELDSTLNQLANLHTLCLRGTSNYGVVEFLDKLEGLHELIILDIQGTEVKYLPWSIMKLPKLQYLVLPLAFRLQTLPFHLRDSILVSVKRRHVRKPWKQLKQEIGVPIFPIAQLEVGKYPSTIAPPGYLPSHQDLGKWVNDNYKYCKLVTMLEVVFPERYNMEGTKISINKLPYLTHLFATNGFNKDCVPLTFNRLKHLSIESGNIKSHSASMSKLSKLESLDLINTTFPKRTNLPLSLRSLSIQSRDISCSFPANISKLYLQTLDLSGCNSLTSLPPLNTVTLRINRIIKSLPIGLRHLEILHVKEECFHMSCNMYCDTNRLEECLTQLVNLEMLSITCYRIKSLPSMSGQRNLRVLLLKDCFALEELLPDMEQLVKLHTLDISGTRIKYLPDSIIKLSKLQKLTLPKCFTQELPTKLEEVVIDDTDKRYYEHMGYYDFDYQTVSDSSSGKNDDDKDEEVGSVEGADEAITQHPMQGVVDEQAFEQSDDIAENPTVSMSTMKRISNEDGPLSPFRKRMKQCDDPKEGEPNTDSTCLGKPFEPADGHEQQVSKDVPATKATFEKPPLEFVKESHVEFLQHAEEYLDGAKQTNVAQPFGSLCSFDYVKAFHKGDTVWIDFLLTSSFDQLKESICKKFGLEVNTVKIKYLDEDEEWLLMTCISDLTHALIHTSSSGRKFVRLSITLTMDVNTGQAFVENHEHPNRIKSDGGSTWTLIHSEREKSVCVRCAEENSEKPASRRSIPYLEFCLPYVKSLIERHIDVKADGNCGFRVIAIFEYGDEEKWLDVRIDLLKELNANKDLYRKALGGNEEFERARSMVNWLVSPAKKIHWFEATCLGLVVSTKYQKVFTCWSTECCTYLPLVSRLVDHKPPTTFINMARVDGNHFIALRMPTNIPLPPLSLLWKRHRCDTVKHWSTSVFKKQLDDYLQLR